MGSEVMKASVISAHDVMKASVISVHTVSGPPQAPQTAPSMSDAYVIIKEIRRAHRPHGDKSGVAATNRLSGDGRPVGAVNQPNGDGRPVGAVNQLNGDKLRLGATSKRRQSRINNAQKNAKRAINRSKTTSATTDARSSMITSMAAIPAAPPRLALIRAIEGGDDGGARSHACTLFLIERKRTTCQPVTAATTGDWRARVSWDDPSGTTVATLPTYGREPPRRVFGI